MTDEQIRQNAEEYANKLVERDYHEDIWLDLYDAHIAGAHSRDEEIEELKRLLAEMKRLKNSFAGAVDILDRDNKELQEKIKQLSNPWISVDERLPENGQVVICRSDKGYFGVINGYKAFSLLDEQQLKKCTHWMLVPEV